MSRVGYEKCVEEKRQMFFVLRAVVIVMALRVLAASGLAKDVTTRCNLTSVCQIVNLIASVGFLAWRSVRWNVAAEAHIQFGDPHGRH